MQGHYLCDHVINEAVLVPDAGLLILFLVVLLVHLLEDLQEAAIIDLQNGVLCGQVQRPADTHTGMRHDSWAESCLLLCSRHTLLLQLALAYGLCVGLWQRPMVCALAYALAYALACASACGLFLWLPMWLALAFEVTRKWKC